MLTLNQVKATVLGHAVGDALGVPVEFQRRDDLSKNPVTDMQGFGVHNMPVGTWSDDTSMTLALLESLGRLGLVDYDDIMGNFLKWLNEAKFTATGKVFDVGIATKRALSEYSRGTEPLSCGGEGEYDNGNGSLMRISPLALWLCNKKGTAFGAGDMELFHKVSSLTHAHPKSKMACGIYGFLFAEIANNAGDLRCSLQSAMEKAYTFYNGLSEYKESMYAYSRLWDIETLAELPEDVITSSGYVVHTLEAALWALLQTKTYKDSILLAVNLGDDTDTVAAITGGIAGLFYGLEAIPDTWLAKLREREYIDALCDQFYDSLNIGKE